MTFSSEYGFGDDVTIVLDLAAVAFGDETFASALRHLLQKLLGKHVLLNANRREIL